MKGMKKVETDEEIKKEDGGGIEVNFGPRTTGLHRTHI